MTMRSGQRRGPGGLWLLLVPAACCGGPLLLPGLAAAGALAWGGLGLAGAALLAGAEVAGRTLQRWAARYRADGLAGLARRERADRGTRRFPQELQLLIEGLALKRPPPSIATIHRDVTAAARQHSWPVPSYATVHDVVRDIDPALAVLAHEGTRRYEELYDLVYRREASQPNEIWQADHTQLDLWVITPSGQPAPG